MNKKIILIVLPLFIILHAAQAQKRIVVRGKVSDGIDFLPGVTVVELDKNNRIAKGTTTNIDGEYVISLSNSEHKLQFSFIGYKEKVVAVDGQTSLNIVLEEDVKTLESIDIIAQKITNTGMMNVEDRDLAIPVAKISAMEFQNVQASSIDEAIQGRLAGIDITSNSGDPGAGMSIRIRGVSTLSANATPLIVVDNIPYEVSIASDFSFSTANEEGYSQMLNIPVDDINEITVLKDAAATAMWGTKAANGVLMITTKRGARGREPVISFNYKNTYSFNPGHIPLLNGDQYSTLILEAYQNSYGVPLNTSIRREFLYSADDPYFFHNYSANTDWLEAITRDGSTNNYDFSITGGGTKAFYRFSVNYQDQIGTTLGTDMNRLSTRLNLDYFISDKLKMRADFSIAHGITNANYTDNSIKSSRGTDARSIAYKKMPNMSIYEFDAWGNQTDNFFSPESNAQGTSPSTYNPVAMVSDGVNRIANDRITTKYSLYYDIFEGLRYTLDLSFDVNSNKINRFLPQTATGKKWTDQWVNKAYDFDSDTYYLYSNNMLSYSNTFNEKHQVAATLNLMTNENIGSAYEIWTSNSGSSTQQDPSNPSKVNESGVGPKTDLSHGRSIGSALLVNYIFDDRYIINGGFRYEGNSRFDENNRYAFFPSISLAWRLSGEPFMSSATWLDDFRFRFSYGENGNPPRYEGMFYSNINSFDWNYMGQSAVYPTNMELKSLKWESIKQTNIGLTFELFKGRIYAEFDYYNNHTEDMFGYNVSVQSTSGFSTNSVINLGTMDNYGWDMSVRTIPVKSDDFKMTFDFNLARNYNILRELADNYANIRNETIGNGEYQTIAQIDNPAGSFYGYRYQGVYLNEDMLIARDAKGNKITDPNGVEIPMVYDYKNTRYFFELGDAMYEDINHDGNINASDIVYLGNANPLFTGGFGSMITWKDFSLNTFFYFRYGNDIINRTRMFGEAMYNYDNQLASTLRRWRKPGDETDIPRALMQKGYNYVGSNRFVEDGSFLRLKYITLSYRLPVKIAQSIGFKSIRASVTVNNLFTFTNYTGQDPEININSSDAEIYTVGYDDSRTPRSKDITFILAVTF
ncbi:MAG TPA: SusC/RagA family TonB-linked outer membrane protein [Prolixibacteraceae bacterium]|nr:SusC/RagA family TonB-linked outer membrane protein [Prolixibacteraceae bacterium]